MVSTMGRKLQIDVTATYTGEAVARIGLAVGAEFEGFRRYCEREALYVVAICQAESKERKAEWEIEQAALAESARQLATYTDTVITSIPDTKPVVSTDTH
jgi:ornithine cyclodeaminase/alanine dehydrogenase-like protein (mu-crystallin family)